LGDFDRDGLLDLYVANYVDFDFKNPPLPGSGEFCRYLGLPVMCGPRGLKGAADVFFRNNGNETFSDETEKRGLNAPSYYGLGVSAGDYDNDGDLDIFVANDSTPNFLFQNQGNGTFKEVGLLAGVAFNEDGNAQACMGVDLADYDNDGFLDVIVTNFARDTNTLYHNEGKGLFRDVSTQAGMRDSYPYMGWAANFFDYDNDGSKDLYVVNGHLYPQVDSTKAEMGYLQADLLYRNLGSGRFLNVSSLLGHGKHVGRGAGFGDLDNDGRVDVVISNLDGQPNVLMNRYESNNHWILVRCIGTEGNRNALGSRVTIVTELGNQTGEVHSGGSYLSSGDQRLHFGLGQVKEIKELRITWPGGRSTLLRRIAVDQVLTIKEP
jgi:enediyne biosynthesis protein E4